MTDVIANYDVFAIATSHSAWRFIYVHTLFYQQLVIESIYFISPTRTSSRKKEKKRKSLAKWLYLYASKTYRITCFPSRPESSTSGRTTNEGTKKTDKKRGQESEKERESNLQLSYIRWWDNYKLRSKFPKISNFCGVSRRYFSRRRIAVVVLTKETRWNWRKIDAKDVDPDGESKRERTFSARWERLIPTAFPAPHYPLSCLNRFMSLSLVERGYPLHISFQVREDRDSLLFWHIYLVFLCPLLWKFRYSTAISI